MKSYKGGPNSLTTWHAMRVEILKPMLYNTLTLNQIAPAFALIKPKEWSLVVSHLPSPAVVLKNSYLARKTLKQTSNQGFFFPSTHPWIEGFRTLKRFRLTTQVVKPLSQLQVRASILWELLEYSELNLSQLKLRSKDIGYQNSGGPLLYSGLRVVKNEVGSPNYQFGSIPVASPFPLSSWTKGPSYATPNGLTQATDVSFLLNLYKNAATPLVTAAVNLDSKVNYTKALDSLVLNSPFTSICRKNPFKQYKTSRRVYPILQTRYKPGLAKAWRLLRMQFCLAWNLPWLRQRRFTNYVTQLNGVTGFAFLVMCVHSIGAITRSAGLVGPGLHFGHNVFVNGTRICNPLYQIYKGDRISALSIPLNNKSRLQKITDMISMPPLRGWEVDGLTNSITILSEPRIADLVKITFLKPLPFLTFRMYNWKYRH